MYPAVFKKKIQQIFTKTCHKKTLCYFLSFLYSIFKANLVTIVLLTKINFTRKMVDIVCLLLPSLLVTPGSQLLKTKLVVTFFDVGAMKATVLQKNCYNMVCLKYSRKRKKYKLLCHFIRVKLYFRKYIDMNLFNLNKKLYLKTTFRSIILC